MFLNDGEEATSQNVEFSKLYEFFLTSNYSEIRVGLGTFQFDFSRNNCVVFFHCVSSNIYSEQKKSYIKPQAVPFTWACSKSKKYDYYDYTYLFPPEYVNATICVFCVQNIFLCIFPHILCLCLILALWRNVLFCSSLNLKTFPSNKSTSKTLRR